jgi:antitoxin component of MazEF toxin-antitoxin module
MAIQKILKVGNSLGITLPSNLVKDLSLKPGDTADVVRELNNNLTVNFPPKRGITNIYNSLT